MASGRLTTLGSRRRRRGFPLLPVASLLMLSGAAALFIIQLVNFSQQSDRLPAGLTVAGVAVGGLTPGEAVARWESAYAQPIILYYENSPIVLEPAQVGFRTSRDTMLAAALASGESGGGFWLRFFNYLTLQEFQQPLDIPLTAEYQENLLRQFILDIAARYDRPAGNSSYDLQTLTIIPGGGGAELDVEAAVQMVDAALRDPNNRTVVLPVRQSESSSPGLQSLRELIIAYLDSQGFIFDGQSTIASVYIMDLQTGEEISLLGDVAFSAASMMKVGILIDYFRYLAFAPSQDEAWLLANSLLCSNNASSNLLMQISGGGRETDLFNGIANVTNTVQYIGARNTFITAPFVLGIQGQQLGSIPAPPTSPNQQYRTTADPYNQTTTEDLGTMFAMIYDCAYYGSGLMAAYPEGEFTQNECRQMLELMSGNDLLRLLQAGLPAGTRISHKNGWTTTDMHGDAGIVFPPNGRNYVIAVMLWENSDFFPYNRAWPLIEGISRAAWNYFSPEQPLLTPRTDIPELAQDCEGNYLPPDPSMVDLYDIDGWRNGG